MKSLLSFPLLLPLVLLTVPPSPAADWPQWRGQARDGHAALAARAASYPDRLTPAWKVAVGEGHSSPLLAGGKVYAFAREGEEEALSCLDLGTGRRLWRQAYPAPYTMNSAATSHGKGPKATPAVAGGRVFAFGISGILSAFDAATGRLAWRKEFGAQYGETSPLYGAAQSPLVDGDRVIVHVGGPGKGALTAFDAATGTVRWAWTGDGPGYASPVVATIAGTRQVVALTESFLVGVSADRGELLWKLPFTTPWLQNAVTPIVDGDTVVYTGLDQPVRAARVARKAAAWVAEPRWENAEVSCYMSTPVLEGGRLFGLSNKKRGQLFALDAATGRVAWLGEGRQGDNAALVAGGGRVFALTTGGELLAFPPSGDAAPAPRRWRVAESPTWAHPVLTDEGVLVKDETHLAYLRY